MYDWVRIFVSSNLEKICKTETLILITTRVTRSQQVLPNISQLRNAVLPTSDDHLHHLDAIVQNLNANPYPNHNRNLGPNISQFRNCGITDVK